MSDNRLLGGENVTPRTAAQARLLIGKKIQWLCHRDIDKSGRGYFFPQTGTIESVHGRNVEIAGGDWIALSSFVEMRAVTP